MNSEIINGALTASRAAMMRNESDIVYVACIVAIVGFLCAVAALLQCRRLRTELKDIRRATQRLMSSEEKRLLRDIAELAHSKASTDEP